MKKIATVIVLFTALICHAQQEQPVYIYGEIGGGGGTGGSIRFDLNSLFLKDNIVSVGYYGYEHRAYNVPIDYSPGFLGGYPHFSMSMLTLMYGKMFFVPDVRRIRFSIKGGLALGTLTKPENFTYISNTGWLYLGSNYDYDNARSGFASLILNPSMEFPLTRGFGFRLGMCSLMNTYSSSVEIEGSILFGHLRYGARRQAKHITVESTIDH